MSIKPVGDCGNCVWPELADSLYEFTDLRLKDFMWDVAKDITADGLL